MRDVLSSLRDVPRGSFGSAKESLEYVSCVYTHLQQEVEEKSAGAFEPPVKPD
jgi:hypothetical protein